MSRSQKTNKFVCFVEPVEDDKQPEIEHLVYWYNYFLAKTRKNEFFIKQSIFRLDLLRASTLLTPILENKLRIIRS